MKKKIQLHNVYLIVGTIVATLAMNTHFEVKIDSFLTICKNYVASPLWLPVSFCFVLGLQYIKKRIAYKNNVSIEIASVFLMLFTILGYNFYRSNQMFPEPWNIYMVLLYGIQCIGYYIFYKSIIVIIFQTLTVIRSKNELFSHVGNIKQFYMYYFILLIAKIPYFIVLFPGVTTADSLSQIAQAANAEALSNHNPIFMTYIIKAFLKIGDFICGNILTGIFLYVAFQVLFTTAILAYVTYYIKKQGAHKYIILGLLAFFIIYPITAIYSVTVWKDVLLSYFILAYCIFLHDMCTAKNFFQNWKKVIAFIICVLCLLFIKKTGLYIVVLTFPVIVLYKKIYWKQLSSITMLSVVIYFITTGPIFNAFNFESGDAREGFSVIMQAYARTVYDHGDDLSPEEWNYIHDVIPLEKGVIQKSYDPRCSNPIKSFFVTETFKNELGGQMMNWISLGIQYPGTYIESFLNGSFGYWFPDNTYWTFSTASYLERDIEGRKSYDENMDTYNVEYMGKVKNILKILDATKFKQLFPIIGLFFTIAPYSWLYGILCMFLLHKKDYVNAVSFFPLFIVLLTCMASPVHSEFRYAYPIVLTVPFMLALCLKKNTERKERGSINEKNSNSSAML